MREGSSPSFFNPEEVLQVKLYVQQLLDDDRPVPRIGKFYLLLYGHILNRPKEPAHIGILTPYRAQCTKLRTALRPIASSEIKIGSVEEFQGDVGDFIKRFSQRLRYGHTGTSSDHHHDGTK
jgi:helicase MOV-10